MSRLPQRPPHDVTRVTLFLLVLSTHRGGAGVDSGETNLVLRQEIGNTKLLHRSEKLHMYSRKTDNAILLSLNLRQ